LAEAGFRIAGALWVGSLWAIGYLAVPVLFAQLGDRMLAGRVAGVMFEWQAWTGFACGSYMLVFLLARDGRAALASASLRLAAAMLVLAAVGHVWFQPLMAQLKAAAAPVDIMASALRDRFAFWHGIASVVYLVESLLGLWLVAAQVRRHP
jgi:hypothetical protein